jgi:hypothetical protein
MNVAPLISNDEWVRGFAAALGAVLRLYDQGTIVVNVMNADGITLRHLKHAGVEAFDLDPITKAYRYSCCRRS